MSESTHVSYPPGSAPEVSTLAAKRGVTTTSGPMKIRKPKAPRTGTAAGKGGVS